MGPSYFLTISAIVKITKIEHGYNGTSKRFAIKKVYLGTNLRDFVKKHSEILTLCLRIKNILFHSMLLENMLKVLVEMFCCCNEPNGIEHFVIVTAECTQ